MLTNLTDNTIAVIKELVALWPQIELALRLPGTITGSGAARVSRNASGIVIHVDPAGKVTPDTDDGARLFLVKITGGASGTNKLIGDAYLPGKGLKDPTSPSLQDTDLGDKVFSGALFAASGSIGASTIVAGWLVGFTSDGKAAFVSLGGGSLPTGQYMGQWYGMPAQNQSGFSFLFASSMADS